MTDTDTTPPTDAELVEKMQTLCQAADAFKRAYTDFFGASFQRLASIVKDAMEAYDDMAGQTFEDYDGGDQPPLDGAILPEGVSFEQAERNAAAWSDPEPKLGKSAYTEGWDGDPPSHQDAAWLNAHEHGRRNRRLHDAGPPPVA